MGEKLRVIIKKPKEEPEIAYVEDDLDNWREIVGGYIEIVYMNPRGSQILMVCNEEGKIIGLEPNILYGMDVIVGTVVFVASKDGDFRGLTDDEVEEVWDYLY